MKSQSLKLFAMALVMGLVTIFAAGSVSAQTKVQFETGFDFHVGKDRLAAGKYEMKNVGTGKYLLRNAATGESRIVVFDITAKASTTEKAERITFNRYGETYFLNSLFATRDGDGRQLIESKLEKQIRKGEIESENQLAGGKAKREKVSVNLSK